jgi:hypothetical protein
MNVYHVKEIEKMINIRYVKLLLLIFYITFDYSSYLKYQF